MAQVTWRVEGDLLDRVRHAARERGWSVNHLLTVVMDAATDPTHAADEAAALRERLRRAGLLAEGGRPHPRPDRGAVVQARKAAGAASRCPIL
jgi:hypothetical protein